MSDINYKFVKEISILDDLISSYQIRVEKSLQENSRSILQIWELLSKNV